MPLPQYKNITLLFHADAGSGEGGKLASQVTEGLRSLFSEAELEVIETKSKQHIEEIGQSSTADLIVCLSGDGSVHDLAQPLVDRAKESRPTVAVIPAGSGNDYAQTLGMPLDPLKALQLLPQCRPLLADVGRVNGVYFVETLSFGVDAAVALNTEELRRSTGSRGVKLYARAAVSAVLNELNAHKVHIKIDNREFDLEALICAVQNGPTYGSGFRVAPHASITDGMLDVYTASGIGRAKALYYLSQMKPGKHEQLKGFTYYRTAQLELSFTEQIPIQCDGERLLGLDFAIDVVPQALEVLVSPESTAC